MPNPNQVGVSPFGGGSGGLGGPIKQTGTGRGGGAGGNTGPERNNGGAGAGMIEYWE